ncbi:RNA 2',3'-cyclic phosphodiesterase [Streptomyces sodiiphilus]|uniref:RNA 2',3'-cyclic phosphodiesterase n=1 Tax=Streptomyces sodiiphilus TaxID=226217 RepID=A0ABN2NU93_9ACTN
MLPPEGAIAELSAAERELRGLPGAERLRRTDPAGRHITLAFYGETDDSLVPGLRDRLAEVALRHAPFPLRLTGGGRFSGRVLWADVEGDREALGRLAADTRAAGLLAGVPPPVEPPEYRPHLTLAFAKKSDRVPLDPFVAGLAGFRGSLWRAGQLALVSSRLPDTAAREAGRSPRYVTEALWPLTG